MEFFPKALDALNQYKQFVIYKVTISSSRTGKFDKIPIDPKTRKKLNWQNEKNWISAEEAIAYTKWLGIGYGIGFVFTKDDPFWFLDIDDCLEPCNTKWSSLAIGLLTTFNGAAVEVSSSGRGLHIIGSGNPPPHSCRNAALKLEFYTSCRFVALTGTQAIGDAAFANPAGLEWLVHNYFPQKTPVTPVYWTTTPREEWRGPVNDDELIQRALLSQSSRKVFGGGASFRDLWERNEDVLSRAFHDNSRLYNESSADAALAQHLAFWTGNNCERIKRLMLRSSLVRDKWQREDYLPRTILNACGQQKEWLVDKLPEPAVTSASTQAALPRAVLVQGNTFLSIEQQIEIFAGCVYIADENKILVPGGYTFGKEQFNVMFGGYSMPMDNKNERVSRNAWEVFTQSQAFRKPWAHTSCFKPDEPPVKIITRDEQQLVNTYWPIKTLRKTGDPAPFLNHLAKLCPDRRDQLILLSYMAAIVQYKGVKFQWCPLIQGVQGNGKTLLSRCVAFAVGDRYSHIPKSAEISNRFNDWLYGKIFIAIEDIYVPEARLEVMEIMKPMITAERQEIEPKGGAKITRDICANFLINTNHKEGLRKTSDDRRFAPFYTAQQSVADLRRDGLLGDYFSNLYRWIAKDGKSIVCELLHTFEIPDEFNPATECKRAPVTSSTDRAITHGLGSIEQEILECIDQSIPGFKSGWISSMAIDRLLDRINANRRIPHNKRRDLLQTLGYDWHPHLRDGRVNNIVLPDNGKPRLYILREHKDIRLECAATIAKAYEEAQM